MSSEKTSNKFFGDIGIDGLSKILPSGRQAEDIKLVKKLCKKSDKILDLACGYGRVTIPIAKLGYDITGMDLLPKYIKKAKLNTRKAKLKIQFDIGSMLRLPYKKDSFDKILCLWTSFSYILKKSEQIKALNEIFRVLRPNGIAFIDTFDGDNTAIKLLLKEEGQGVEKRLLFLDYDIELNAIVHGTLHYVHDRKSLANICKASKFKHFIVGFKNMYGGRRLAVYLNK
ncbi:MAG: class I SAM-dependent methyltransferase [Candidatus Margulisbacteria bacterium]|nr:class I SAM-dependent methyltransferase [Candidatus Margulisiibacteriota bacterium]MBU1021078.1 class I SAM-dependent methyltransferase [Candidatus Margulisiibacteriota bacterium]MBU1729887.1 class I SAM-dependent methyltransferase [Candidatus Margulisiibacteriota bacterium]MBU1955217.1 class I SAM-dependent methyltransferase [Candidatus Margulisiibacteriota bacterium]